MNQESKENSPSPEQSSYAKMQAEYANKKDPKNSEPENAQESAESTESDDTNDLSPEETLQQAERAFEKEKKELILRHLADSKNLQERQHREMAKARDYAIQSFAQDLLSIADALHQGIDSAEGEQKKGLQLILDVFHQTLTKHSISPLHPQGEAYDPHWHEAMVMQPNPEVENNHIIQVIQTGYKLKDRLLRPARVIVAKNTA